MENETNHNKYCVMYHHYEFQTKQDHIWTGEDVLEAFNNQTETDPYCVDSFATYDEAMNEINDYMENHAIAPYKQRTNNGWVVLGEVIELVEYDLETDECINQELFTKGEK